MAIMNLSEPTPPDDAPRAAAAGLFANRTGAPALGRADSIAGLMARAAGVTVLLIAAGIVWQLVSKARPSVAAFGLPFLWSGEWDPVGEKFGAWPFLYGTLVSSAIALAIATPFGVGTALFLTELAPARLRSPVAFVVEMLAAIPSVVYGLWGIFVLSPLMAGTIGPFLIKWFGWSPLFKGPCFGVSMLTAGIILAVMVVPYITSLSREVLRTVPPELKAASYALGATPWETIWKVVLPHARVGIGGGVVLALGRALGETMAVTMVIGNSPTVETSLLRPAYTMSAVIANEFREATGTLYLASLVNLGLVLFVVTLAINLAARLLLTRMSRAGAR